MKKDGQELIWQIRDGRTDNISLLVNNFGSTLMAFVSRIVTRQEDAEDVVQNTFVAAYEHLDDYDPTLASVATWLQRIAYHETLYHLRRRKRHTFLPIDVGKDVPDEIPDTTTVEQLDEAIKKLSPEDQILLQLYYFDQRQLKDIAYITSSDKNHLDREASRLSSQLHRIRQRLRIILTHMNDE